MNKAAKVITLISFLLILSLMLWGVSRGYFSFSYRESLGSKLQGRNEFTEFLAAKKKLPQKDGEVSFVAVGDISFSRGVEKIIRQKNDPNYPLAKMKDFLNSADLVFANLETPIIPGPEIQTGQMIFRSSPGTEEALRQAGISLLSLANNHTPNFGDEGLKETFKYLDAAGIKFTGAGINSGEANAPAYFEAKGIRFALLAYNDSDVVPAGYEAGANRPGTAFMRAGIMAEAVKKAREKADIIIISMHSGTEYVKKPNERQVAFARAAIDAGADLIIGHHPHVAQTMELYKGKYIFYSLGNFIFDQPWSEDTEEGLALKIYFTKEGVSKITFLPISMENLAQPEPAPEKRAKKILKRLDFPLDEKVIYFWDGNNYIKDKRATVYHKESSGGNVLKNETADLDKNSLNETYALANGRLTISENSEILWQSPENWWIDNFILADSTGDGVTDLNLSLWKAGNYGESKPFWVKENDPSVKNHFFVYNFIGGKIKAVWHSSNLSAPNCEFNLADLNGDGKNELVVIEGDYDGLECKGEYVAVWQWNGWGFSNAWRSEKGEYYNLEIEKNGEKNYILADSR